MLPPEQGAAGRWRALVQGAGCLCTSPAKESGAWAWGTVLSGTRSFEIQAHLRSSCRPRTHR